MHAGLRKAFRRMFIISALTVATAPYANADWGKVVAGASSGVSDDAATTSLARAMEELARIRARLNTLREEIAGGQSGIAPSVEDIRRRTLATEIQTIMAQPDADASEGLKKVRDMTRNALDDLRAIEEAGAGPGNPDWAEDYE